MGKIFLDSDERGIVVFAVWRSLGYGKRILLSGGLILLGLVLQLASLAYFPGLIAVFLGNLFILPSGYNNRIKLGKYDPKANWEAVGAHKLQEFMDMQKKIRRWDRSTVDASNPLGCFMFLIMLAVLSLIFLASQELPNKYLEMLSVNGAVLLIPLWLSGQRSIFTLPLVTRKIKLIQALLEDDDTRELLKGHDVDYYFLLSPDKKKQVPRDVKLKVDIANHHANFLGLYGQVVINHVQNTPYPYFYMVLVAKKGYGLKQVYDGYLNDPKKIVKEFKNKGDVEVLVVRQNTTRSSGYHTKDKHVRRIFAEGMQLAQKAAVQKA